MKITKAQLKMLAQVKKMPRHSAAWLGYAVYAPLNKRGRAAKPQDFALPAGRVLCRLRDMGLVDWSYDGRHARQWHITSEGEKALVKAFKDDLEKGRKDEELLR